LEGAAQPRPRYANRSNRPLVLRICRRETFGEAAYCQYVAGSATRCRSLSADGRGSWRHPITKTGRAAGEPCRGRVGNDAAFAERDRLAAESGRWFNAAVARAADGFLIAPRLQRGRCSHRLMLSLRAGPNGWLGNGVIVRLTEEPEQIVHGMRGSGNYRTIVH
jgi:hypothetical protein